MIKNNEPNKKRHFTRGATKRALASLSDAVNIKHKSSKQRIHKLLASLGMGSRRAIEQWISEGKIQVNGKPATIGQAVSVEDKIILNGRLLNLAPHGADTTRVLLYNKPEGEICSHQSFDGKKTVYDNLPRIRHSKWISVGRLDVNTSGLLLFTNDGELAHRLMHPRFAVERRYLVRVKGKVTEAMLARLRTGVKLEEGVCRFKEILQHELEPSGINQWFIVSLMEGKYREVRRLWESQDCLVSRLVRIQYGDFELPRRLRKGHYLELPEKDVQALLTKTNQQDGEVFTSLE